MAIYLVDYENVYIEGLDGISHKVGRSGDLLHAEPLRTDFRTAPPADYLSGIGAPDGGNSAFHTEEHREKRTGFAAFYVHWLSDRQTAAGSAVHHQQGHRF